MYSATTANPGSVPPNNFSAASAAAEQVEAYARNQHQQSLHNAANRLTHYPADAQFVGSHMPPTGMGMTTKPIHANGCVWLPSDNVGEHENCVVAFRRTVS